MTIREDLAGAATLPDVTDVSPLYRQNLRTGVGFVRRGQRVRAANRFGWIDTWEIWIALPADRATADEWLDTHLDSLIDAISARMAVTLASPNELALGPGEIVNGLIITGAIGT